MATKTPTPVQEPVRHQPQPERQRRVYPAWVSIVAFVVAALFLVGAVAMYSRWKGAANARDAAQAQVTSLQQQVSSLTAKSADQTADVARLNDQVKACQLVQKIDVARRTGTVPSDLPPTAYIKAVEGCWGTAVPDLSI